MSTRNRPTAPSRRRQRGSLFLVALLVLSLVTIIGLSMVTITETEMLLGTSEWVIAETHFATESGMSTQFAQLLVTNDTSPVDIVLPSYFGELDERSQIGFEIKGSGLFPITMEELPYSKANVGSADVLLSAFFYTHIRGRRVAWDQDQDVPTCADMAESVTGQKHIVNGFYYSPVEPLQADALIQMERAALDKDFGIASADRETTTDGGGTTVTREVVGTGSDAWAFCDARVGEAPLYELILESDNTPGGTPGPLPEEDDDDSGGGGGGGGSP